MLVSFLIQVVQWTHYFCRLELDLSMEKRMFGSPYDWLLFACLELTQLGGTFLVYFCFRVSQYSLPKMEMSLCVLCTSCVNRLCLLSLFVRRGWRSVTLVVRWQIWHSFYYILHMYLLPWQWFGNLFPFWNCLQFSE